MPTIEYERVCVPAASVESWMIDPTDRCAASASCRDTVTAGSSWATAGVTTIAKIRNARQHRDCRLTNHRDAEAQRIFKRLCLSVSLWPVISDGCSIRSQPLRLRAAQTSSGG